MRCHRGGSHAWVQVYFEGLISKFFDLVFIAWVTYVSEGYPKPVLKILGIKDNFGYFFGDKRIGDKIN